MRSHLPVDRPSASLVALVWSGSAGLAFVASLAYFVYFYFVGLGRTPATRPGAPTRAIAINVLLFTLFAAHHSVMARTRAKQWIARLVRPSLERAMYVWVASLLFFAVCWWWQGLPGRLYRVDGWAAAAFFAVQAGGIVFALRSATSIDVFELAGIEQARRGDPAPLEAPAAHEMGRLETSGPYRIVRHPIYFGTLILLVATPDLTTDRLLFTALTLGYMLVGIALEERSLREKFRAAYDAYAREVRWRLVPGVY